MNDVDVSFDNGVTMRTDASVELGHIDQYELVRELGGGGFGCVYLAKDTVSGIEVAVKGLPPEVKHNKEEIENIRQNFALVSRLHHPNIAAALVLHPVFKAEYPSRDAMEKLRVFERDTMMVMEFAPGVTLSQWRKQFPDKKVPFEKALGIIRQVASALDYAHAQKVVHRDVKPANVMVETKPGGELVARILDFGLAAEIRSSMGRVSREIRDTSGTRPYMAPEQWRGTKQGPATDQYALAAMFCELVTGEVPFASVFDTGDPVVMLTNVTTMPPVLPDELSPACRKALLKALAKTPEERFATCSELVDALGGKRVHSSRAANVNRRPTDRTSANGLKIAFGGTLVALVALAVACCWMWIAQKNAEELRQTEIARREGESRALALQQAEAAARAAEARTSEERRLAAERARISEQKRKEAAAAERERQMAEKRRREEADRLQREQEERLAAEKRAREEAEQKKRREEESKRLRDEATQRALAFFADGKLKEGLEASKNGDSANPQLVFWSAVCAERGIGEPADEGKAAELYRRAAEAGNPDAQHKYGLMKFFGRTVEKNVAEAMVLNIKAAEQGCVKAQKFLAIQWEAGTVVPRNMTKAENWYRKAAENGDDYAKKWLEKNGK